MLIVLILIVLIALILGAATERRPPTAGNMLGTDSVYELSVKTLAGELVDLKRYHGRVSLVVNTGRSPDCAPRYEELEALHREYARYGFTVLCFLSADLAGPTLSTAAVAQDVGHPLDGATFPVFAESDEVDRTLTADLEPPDGEFTMDLVDWTGQAVARFGPQTRADDAELRAAIEKALESE